MVSGMPLKTVIDSFCYLVCLLLSDASIDAKIKNAVKSHLIFGFSQAPFPARSLQRIAFNQNEHLMPGPRCHYMKILDQFHLTCLRRIHILSMVIPNTEIDEMEAFVMCSQYRSCIIYMDDQCFPKAIFCD